MKQYLFLFIVLNGLVSTGCRDQQKQETSLVLIIGKGQMPNAVNDDAGHLHVVFGSGDSIMYSSSMDKGISFSNPEIVSILPGLAASHMRGPQIAARSGGLTIIACNKAGDIFSYTRGGPGKWMDAGRVNDVDTVAKEGLMALDGDKETLFAVWLDLRDRHNKIVGARSNDGGTNWSKNILIYTSSDSTVCECCKPSVIIRGEDVYVMFRNWLNGNRDMYLIHSNDNGLTFNNAEKLGDSSWALNGCPMDGGSLAIMDSGRVQTVWNRKGSIYACEPGMREHKLGEGRNGSLVTAGDENIYAWIEKGEIVCLLPRAGRRNLGKGHSPLLKGFNNNQVMCIWQNEKEILGIKLDL